MSADDALLNALKFVLVGVIYLFFMRVLRAVWAELREPAPSHVANANAPARAPAAPTSKISGSRKTPAILRVIEPPERKNQSYELREEVTVGRAEGCHIKIDDTYASQLHARIYRSGGGYVVEDLGSTNGTFLNKRKLKSPHPLHTGDRVQIGRIVLEARK